MKIKRPAPVPASSGNPKRAMQQLKLRASIARSRSSRVKDEDEDYYDAPEPNMKLSHAFVVVLVLHVIAVGGVFAFNTIKSNQRSGSGGGAVSAESTEAASAPVAANEKPVESTPPGIIAPPSRPLAAEAPVAADAPKAGTHEVTAGETLHRIASQYGVSVAALQEINEITDPTKVRIGTLLILPANAKTSVQTVANTAPATSAPTTTVASTTSVTQTPSPTSTTPAAAPAKATAIADSGEVYEVVKGDNPVSIAKKLNVSYNDLLTLNQIEDPRKLQIGQKLKVPSAN